MFKCPQCNQTVKDDETAYDEAADITWCLNCYYEQLETLDR